MTYLGPRVLANFRPEVNPNKKREPKRREHRPGMDPDHLANIRKLPSIISGRMPCDPHHLRVKQSRGTGLRAEDRWAIPLCRDEHIDVHKVGSRKERQWFIERGVDCYLVANALWKAKGDVDAMNRIILANLPGETE